MRHPSANTRMRQLVVLARQRHTVRQRKESCALAEPATSYSKSICGAGHFILQINSSAGTAFDRVALQFIRPPDQKDHSACPYFKRRMTAPECQ